MERLSAYNWEEDSHYTILIVTEEDVLNETSYRGAGFEVVILPKKFEDAENLYVASLKIISGAKKLGRIIYV